MAVESLGRVLGTSRIAVVSRKCLDTSMIALQSLRRDQQDDSWLVYRTSLRTSRMAVESLKRALGPAGYLGSFFEGSWKYQDCCDVYWKSMEPAV